MTVKIQAVVGTVQRPFRYGNVYSREKVGERERLRIGINDAQHACVQLLTGRLPGPFQLLYVLHTARTDARRAAYESPELDARAVQEFLLRFGRFLSEDSRHDLWIRSHGDDATIVLDRHNLIYAYGPLETFEAALREGGIRLGTLKNVPDPHVHHYHPEWDRAEGEILRTFQWTIKPLRRSDVQCDDGPNDA